MRRAEARDLVRATTSLARGVAGVVRATGDAATEFVYAPLRHVLDPALGPVHGTHRRAASTVSDGVDIGLRGAGLLGELAVAIAMRDQPSDPPGEAGTDSPSVLQHRRGGFALGLLNGIAGDRLDHDGSTLALPTTLRHDGRDVPLTTEALRAAYGLGHRRLVVFVHGLVETELAWRYRARQRWGDGQVGYGSLLQRDEGWLALYVRYNTGVPLAANADRLGDLLEGLVAAWPEPAPELALVGHSMGGLVALTALAHDVRAWTRRVRAVVTLGSPRDGAPLERTAAVVEEFADRTGGLRWLGGLVGVRSGGIRDLHDPLSHPPIPERIDEYAVLATLTPASWHPHVPRVGDGLVPVPQRHHCETAVLHGLHHLDLLNHPEVYPLLRGWLGGAWDEDALGRGADRATGVDGVAPA